jgi:hypothetical protein
VPKPDDLLKLLKAKKDRLDWEKFHFLENLLIFCAMQDYSVPAESGVCFRISREPKDDVICILFQIDRQSDPLIREVGTPRPDYLALYMDSHMCLFTIIEMKGREAKGPKHGVDQILSLKNELSRQFQEHFPLGQKAKFQGILLCPYNADIPRELIKKEADQGFTILPLLYSNKAELFPYVSNVNASTERYKHTELPHQPGYGFLEELLICSALHQRLPDSCSRAAFSDGKRPGLYINYVLSKTEYAVFLVKNGKNTILIKQEEAGHHRNRITADLQQFGIGRHFQVQLLNEE